LVVYPMFLFYFFLFHGWWFHIPDHQTDPTKLCSINLVWLCKIESIFVGHLEAYYKSSFNTINQTYKPKAHSLLFGVF
jgi:hypothetical protein